MIDLVIRVDASAQIGVGHAMRCATLAEEMVRRGHRVSVRSNEMMDWIASRFGALGIPINSPGETPIGVSDHASNVAPDTGADRPLMLFDGYGLGPELRQARASGMTAIAIDDNMELPVEDATLVINQNLHADALAYPRSGRTSFLLGPSFALIRSDVRSINRTPRPVGSSPEVLVALGGTDTMGLTASIASALTTAAKANVCVAISTDHRDRSMIEHLVDTYPGRVTLATKSLVDPLANADIAIIGAGSTMWEAAYLGLPTIALVVADNQVLASSMAAAAQFTETFDVRPSTASTAEGSGPDYGPASLAVQATLNLLEQPKRRDRMCQAGKTLFDGRGAERVADAIENLAVSSSKGLIR